jgi:hypothetical protein
LDASDVLAALSPFAVYIAFAVILLLLYLEARGAWSRVGTTNRRSSAGSVGILVILAVLAFFLIGESWSWLGGLVLAAVLLIGAAWALATVYRKPRG